MIIKQHAYRERIYRYYVRSLRNTSVSATLDGLRSRAPYLKRLIRRHFPADLDGRILDLGCGNGALIHFARQRGYQNVNGVDRSPEQVAEAKRLGIEGVREGDIMETLCALSGESHDIIVAFDVIEHFWKDELLNFVDEVFRVLKKGGKWIIHCPNGESPFCGRIVYGDFSHELCLTRKSISQLLIASGFSQVTSYEDTPIPHGIKSFVRWACWKVIRMGLRFYMAVETGAGEQECIFTQNFLTVGIK